jgi:hypothetical protein
MRKALAEIQRNTQDRSEDQRRKAAQKLHKDFAKGETRSLVGISDQIKRGARNEHRLHKFQ